MDLFPNDPESNLLPVDGTATYRGSIFPMEKSQEFFQELLTNIPWRHDEVIMFGKHITTARKVAWVADEGMAYAYSGKSREPVAWSGTLRELKTICEKHTGASYNSCLLNLYQDGSQGMGWHSDDERSIVPQSSIACLSFGAVRKFSFKHKRTRETVSLQLENGSLLDMRGATQENWHHQLSKSRKVKEPRISLTFRRMRLKGSQDRQP